MWEIIVESGIIALAFGLVTSITGIIITNNYSKKQEQRERKYTLTKEIYQKLIVIYNKELKENNVKEIDKQSAENIFQNALTIVYQDANKQFNRLMSSYLEIKYILDKNDVKDLNFKFDEIEEIGKILFFTSFNDILKDKEDYENIVVNEDVNMIECDKIPEYMRKYIDKTKELERFFLDIIEKKLRQLLK